MLRRQRGFVVTKLHAQELALSRETQLYRGTAGLSRVPKIFSHFAVISASVTSRLFSQPESGSISAREWKLSPAVK